MIEALLFLYGLVVGSFLNVCIHRLPRHESVIQPRSRCPQCNHAIAAYDNIPLMSYLLLRGRCRHCRARISPLYLFVELATGLLALFLYAAFGLTAAFAKAATLGAALLVLTVTDWRERLLPDRVTFPGMILGLVFSLIAPVNDGTAFLLARLLGFPEIPLPLESLFDSLLGAGFGSGFVYFLGEAWLRLRKREAMGFGDVKMMAMVGFFLGTKLTLLTIFMGSAVGAVMGVGWIVLLVSRPSYYKRVQRHFRHISALPLYFTLIIHKQGRFKVPFGCFLGVAAMAAAVWGRPILQWYLGYFG